MKNRPLFFHTADLGDIIASLPSVRQMGGGHYMIGEGGGWQFGRETLRGARFEALRPLLSIQPYVDSIEWTDQRYDKAHDFSTFRADYRRHESLAHNQARHVGLETIDTAPWLKVPTQHHGKVVFARSSRYPNGFFPWFALLKRYPEALFVGLPSEHAAFESEFGCRIAYQATSSLLELARLLAGARLFCGNQSCPWWVAFALGVPTFQETWEHDRNSMIERHNAYYMTGAMFDLERLPA